MPKLGTGQRALDNPGRTLTIDVKFPRGDKVRKENRNSSSAGRANSQYFTKGLGQAPFERIPLRGAARVVNSTPLVFCPPTYRIVMFCLPDFGYFDSVRKPNGSENEQQKARAKQTEAVRIFLIARGLIDLGHQFKRDERGLACVPPCVLLHRVSARGVARGEFDPERSAKTTKVYAVDLGTVSPAPATSQTNRPLEQRPRRRKWGHR